MPKADPVQLTRAQAALEKARNRHRKVLQGLDKERAEIERRADTEETRWQSEQARLEAAFGRAAK